MQRTLAPILDILDEGLRIYRRAFVTFALLAALGAVPPMVLIIGGTMASAGFDQAVGGWLIFAGFLLFVPMLIYAVAAMSRAATTMGTGGRPTARELLAFGPLRFVGMGCYGLIFGIGANIATAIISLVCICPLYLFMLFSLGAAGSIFTVGGGGEAVGILLTSIVVLLLLLIYAISLALTGAAYCSTVFSLQPFVHEQGRFSLALQHSVDFLAYRFGHNLLAFLCASLVFGALSLAVTVGVGLLLPLPLVLALGSDSLIAQSAAGAAWLAGFVLALPPLPIWMALLYERRRAARDGDDLETRLAALTAPTH